MKVLHVIGPLSTGGAQTQLHGLIAAGHGRYWDAALCATSPGALSPWFRSLGVPMIELQRRGSPGFGRMLALRRHVAAGEFDLVNGHLWQANAYARIAVAGRPRRPATLIVEHNVEVDRSFARRTVDRVLDRWTDGYVAVTDAMAYFVQAHHTCDADEVHFIPYAIDKSVFRPQGRPPTRRRTVIGSMGRFDPEKGFEVLIDAVRRMVERGDDVELRLAGSGPLENDLRSSATGLPVDFVGALDPGESVADFLLDLDVFVLASTHREARPVVVLEALSCGVPVVATDIPGMAETAAGGAAIVPPGEAQAIADAVLAVRADATAARQRAVSASKTILDFDSLAARYADVMGTVMRRRRGR